MNIHIRRIKVLNKLQSEFGFASVMMQDETLQSAVTCQSVSLPVYSSWSVSVKMNGSSSVPFNSFDSDQMNRNVRKHVNSVVYPAHISVILCKTWLNLLTSSSRSSLPHCGAVCFYPSVKSRRALQTGTEIQCTTLKPPGPEVSESQEIKLIF